MLFPLVRPWSPTTYFAIAARASIFKPQANGLFSHFKEWVFPVVGWISKHLSMVCRALISLSWTIFLAHVLVALISFKIPKYVNLFLSRGPLHMLLPPPGMLFELLIASYFLSLLWKTIPTILSRLSLILLPYPLLHSRLLFSTAFCSFASHGVYYKV